MKTSTMSLSWKTLVSKIHPPLPLNPRDSEKLLHLLQSSFQRHLDREYPPVQADARHSADAHVHSILTNPLFSLNPRERSISLQSHQSHGKVQNWDHLPPLPKRPVDYIRNQISLGTATIEIAEMCLSSQPQNSLPSSKAKQIEPLNSYDAGLMILRWLWASGIDERPDFFQRTRFIRLLVSSLITEGHESLVWHWLLRLQRSIRVAPKEIGLHIRKLQPRIILQRFQFELEEGEGLNSAIYVFIQKAAEISAATGKSVFQTSARALIRCIISMEDSPSKATLIDSLISSVSIWSARPEYHAAFLGLYRPDHPGVDRAFQFLQNLHMATKYQSRRKRTEIIILSLKTTELLLSEGLKADAMWVMNFLQDNFAEDIGIQSQNNAEIQGSNARRQNEDVVLQKEGINEETSLRLLESLTVH